MGQKEKMGGKKKAQRECPKKIKRYRSIQMDPGFKVKRQKLFTDQESFFEGESLDPADRKMAQWGDSTSQLQAAGERSHSPFLLGEETPKQNKIGERSGQVSDSSEKRSGQTTEPYPTGSNRSGEKRSGQTTEPYPTGSNRSGEKRSGQTTEPYPTGSNRSGEKRSGQTTEPHRTGEKSGEETDPYSEENLSGDATVVQSNLVRNSSPPRHRSRKQEEEEQPGHDRKTNWFTRPQNELVHAWDQVEPGDDNEQYESEYHPSHYHRYMKEDADLDHDIRYVKRDSKLFRRVRPRRPMTHQKELKEAERKELARIMWGSSENWEAYPSKVQLPEDYKSIRSIEALQKLESPHCQVSRASFVNFLLFFEHDRLQHKKRESYKGFRNASEITAQDKRRIEIEHQAIETEARQRAMFEATERFQLDVFPLDANVYCTEIMQEIKRRFSSKHRCISHLKVSDILGAGISGITLLCEKTDQPEKTENNKIAVKLFHHNSQSMISAQEEFEIGEYLHQTNSLLAPRTGCFEKLNFNTYVLLMEPLEMSLPSYLKRMEELSDPSDKQSVLKLLWKAIQELIQMFISMNLTHGDFHVGNIMLRGVEITQTKTTVPFVQHGIIVPNHYRYELVPIDFGRTCLVNNFFLLDLQTLARGIAIQYRLHNISKNSFNFFAKHLASWTSKLNETHRERLPTLTRIDMSESLIKNFEELTALFFTIRSAARYNLALKRNREVLDRHIKEEEE